MKTLTIIFVIIILFIASGFELSAQTQKRYDIVVLIFNDLDFYTVNVKAYGPGYDKAGKINKGAIFFIGDIKKQTTLRVSLASPECCPSMIFEFTDTYNKRTAIKKVRLSCNEVTVVTLKEKDFQK